MERSTSRALVGGPVVVLVATGRTELLVEVANFHHLVMYGLPCVTLVAIRRSDLAWYGCCARDVRLEGVSGDE